MRSHTLTRTARGVAIVAFTVLGSGCATMGGGLGQPDLASLGHLPATSPLRSQSLQPQDMWVRHFSMNATYDSLQVALEPGARTAPKDVLQRDLQTAVSLHLGGEYEASNALFEAAEREADVRYTKSVSQMGLSLLTSDKAMDFTPSRAEMAMIPYYRMQNYLRLGDTDAALVEARKAGSYFRQLEDENGDICRSSTFLKYLTGLIYEMGGEHNDAVVSMRQAEAGYDGCQETYGFGPPASFGPDLVRIALGAGLSDVAEDARKRYGVAKVKPDGSGEVIVVIENGFVAHRSEQTVYFPILKSEVAGLDPKDPVSMLATSTLLTGRLVGALVEQGVWGYTDEPEIRIPSDASLDDLYLMELSWPTYRLEANGAASVGVLAGGVKADAFPVQDVSAEVVRDFEAVKRRVIGRTLARGLVKFLAADQLEKKAESQNPLLGILVGMGANLAANALESADTRTWSLLPDRLEMARLRLPAGEHEIELAIRDAEGRVVRTESAGTVTVRPGETAMVSHRVWGNATGEKGRLARAASGVDYEGFGDGEQATPPASAPPAVATAAATPAATPDTKPVAKPTQAATQAAAPAPAAKTAATSEPAATPSSAPTDRESDTAAPEAARGEAAPAVAGGDREAALAQWPVTHSIAINASHLAAGAFGAEYERNAGRQSVGAVASVFTWDYDVDVITVGARVKAYRGYNPPGGLSFSATVGLASVCDWGCHMGDLSEQFGMVTGVEGGYAWLVGPRQNLALRLGFGLQSLVLTASEDEDGWYYQEPIYLMPSGGISIGYVIR